MYTNYIMVSHALKIEVTISNLVDFIFITLKEEEETSLYYSLLFFHKLSSMDRSLLIETLDIIVHIFFTEKIRP